MAPEMAVLDVGCGRGGLMAELARRGCSVVGVEIDRALVQRCTEAGLRVHEGRAEELPLADAAVDGIVCSVVVPYTDEERAVAEWARVLRPGGTINATFHGVGYGVDYLVHGPGLKRRFYGLRMLVNTMYYRATGRKLPGFVGDTLCQTSSRLQAYYRRCGLTLEREEVIGTVLGAPWFLAHRVVKEPGRGAV
jgi:SAM-dependent methyltransferase